MSYTLYRRLRTFDISMYLNVHIVFVPWCLSHIVHFDYVASTINSAVVLSVRERVLTFPYLYT